MLKVKKLNIEAEIPTRGSKGAVGYDLYSMIDYTIAPNSRAVIPTGISIELPPDTYGRIAPRSGLAVKHGINVGGGVIDPDYTGELKVILFNHDRRPYNIMKGYRIAQLVLEQCKTPDVQIVHELEETVRGDQGFGSTNKIIPYE